MTEPSPDPKYKTGWLWAILLLFSLGGTVGAIWVVWSVSNLFRTGQILFYGPIAVGAAFLALVCVLFVSGILYRVDRLRGVAHREVALFE